MTKKILVLIGIICALPLMAHAASYTITASLTSGTGTVSQASLTRPSGPLSPAPFFDFTPGSGFHVDSIIGLATLPSGSTYTL